jgi:hypothetical protein
MNNPEPAGADEGGNHAPKRSARSYLILSGPVIAVVFFLTLASAVVAYVNGMPLNPADLTPIVVVWFVIVLVARRVFRGGKKK